MNHLTRFSCLTLTLSLACSALASDPWADVVVGYDDGQEANPSFNDPNSALGAPTRLTSPSSPFGGPVTPFNPAFGSDEVVSIGGGGSLTLQFDEPVQDDPNNPFGIDLLVFGNSFLFLSEFPADANTTAASTTTEGGVISVSADGVTYVEVPGVDADGPFPTLGYTDITDPFPASASAPTDFTLPVDPSADVVGLNTSELVALYNGSGGGAGIDLAPLGLSEIYFVKITNPIPGGENPVIIDVEIDAVADVRAVPEPATLLLALFAAPLVRRQR